MLDLIVGLHLYTSHFNQDAGYNNVNPGIYVSADVGTVCRPSGGYYFNSERKDSFWSGCTFVAGEENQYRLVVGAVTGYKNQTVAPMILPQYVKRVAGDFAVGVALIPPVKIADGGGLHCTIERNF